MARSRVELDASETLYDLDVEALSSKPPRDTRAIIVFRAHEAWHGCSASRARAQLAYIKMLESAPMPIHGRELLKGICIAPPLRLLEHDDAQTRKERTYDDWVHAQDTVHSFARRAE